MNRVNERELKVAVNGLIAKHDYNSFKCILLADQITVIGCASNLNLHTHEVVARARDAQLSRAA